MKNSGGLPLYVKGLFTDDTISIQKISSYDRHVFFRKNFKLEHAVYMNFREGFWKVNEWVNLLKARKFSFRNQYALIPPRLLEAIQGHPTVSYIIPTMLRQDFTLTLLEDLKKQTYLPTQVVVVDATPEDKRDESLYEIAQVPENFSVRICCVVSLFSVLVTFI